MVFATVQASKLDFVGSCTSIVAYFDNCILVHIRSTNCERDSKVNITSNDDSTIVLIMTLICLKRINMAIIFDMEPKLSKILTVLEDKLTQHKQQESQTEFH